MPEIPERSPIASAALSIVLTTCGAGAEREQALGDWVTYLNGLGQDYEILLASERADLPAEPLVGTFSRVRVLPPPTRSGFGAALRLGLAAARNPLLFYARCDRCYKPADIKQLLKQIDLVDLVAGYRLYPAGATARHTTDSLYRWFIRLVFGVRLRDANCLFLLARRSIFARIPLQADGLFAHAEVLAKANFLSCPMTEVPITVRPASGGEPISAERPGGPFWADVHRVLSHPDFGPAVLPDQV